MTLDIAAAVPQLTSPGEALATADAVASDLAIGSAERERNGIALIPQLRQVADAGLLGISVLVEHGGPGLPASTAIDVLRRLSRGDAAVGQMLLSHFVVTRTTATPREDGTWVLNGTKYYATGALGAAWIAVAAVLGDGNGETATVFVRPNQDGVTLNLDKWSAFGQRGTASGEVLLDDVVVDGTLVIEEGSPPDPLTGPPFVLGAFDQALHAAIDIGIARAALEDGAEFVRIRSRPWKEPARRSSTRVTRRRNPRVSWRRRRP